ncbi:MAG: biopolymer transporter ExbD, partial [Candidatus Sulfotelmatobacter sp.]
LKTDNLARLNNRMWSVALLALVSTMSAAQQSSAQAMQKGISVELARTSSAVPVPAADNQAALIITVTDNGRLYLGIDPVTPDRLAEKLRALPSHHAQTLYIKADARAPYANVVKVLDAAHTARVMNVTLLTTQPKATQVGTIVSPEGIEMELAWHSAPATK